MAVHPLWLVGTLFFLLIVAAVVVGVIALVARAAGPHPTPPASYPAGPAMAASSPGAHEAPLDILARRFASGEITAEEYQGGRDLLQGGSTPPTS